MISIGILFGIHFFFQNDRCFDFKRCDLRLHQQNEMAQKKQEERSLKSPLSFLREKTVPKTDASFFFPTSNPRKRNVSIISLFKKLQLPHVFFLTNGYPQKNYGIFEASHDCISRVPPFGHWKMVVPSCVHGKGNVATISTTTISSSSSFLVKIVVPFFGNFLEKSSLGSNVAMESSRIFS